MTDERDGNGDASQDEEAGSGTPQPGSAQASSAPDNAVDEMEQGIERVDEHIDEAKEKAEQAERLDPQPMQNKGDEQNSSS